MLDYLSVGYILKPHGIRGEMKVEPLTDYIERFDELDTLYIKRAEQYCPIRIMARRYRGNHVFLVLEGYDNLDKTEKLRGQYLWIPRDEARALPEDSFFVADIIGCAVFTEEGRPLGHVDGIIHTGSNDVYVTKGSMGQILIPGLKKVVLDVDIQSRKIIVAAQELEGLLPDAD